MLESDYNEMAAMCGEEELVCARCDHWLPLKGERGYGTCARHVFDGDDMPKSSTAMLHMDGSCRNAERGFFFSPNADLLRRVAEEDDDRRTRYKLADEIAREAWA